MESFVATSPRNPRNMVSSNAHSSIHIRSIEVKFKTTRDKHRISVEATFGEKTEISKRYDKNEDIHWLCDKQLPSGSQLTIVIQEHHRVHRTKNIATVPVPDSELKMRPFFEISDSVANPISITIHCGTGGPFIEVIRRLVEQTQVRLESMSTFLEKFGRACEVLNYAFKLVSSVHPAAESAASMATILLELCQKQQECHSTASELMEDVANFLPFTDIPEGGLKCEETARTADEMLQYFEAVCRAIIDYSDGSTLGGLLDDRIDEIRSYQKKFERLKETFGWCLKTEIWKTTLRIEANTEILVLQKLLKPVTEACYSEDKLCFEGSRRDTLELIEAWSESESSPKLFWLSGSSGLGKTAIAHTVSKLFHDQNRLAGSFFSDDRQDSKQIIPTIAYHLAKRHAGYQRYILDVLQSPQAADVFAGLGNQFDFLVRRAMSEPGIHPPPTHRPLIIVLDSPKNCCGIEDSRQPFVDYIVDIAKLVPWLKVFVSGRRSEDIERCFSRVETRHLALDDDPLLDLNHDIAICARLCVEHRSSLKDWTQLMRSDVHGLFTRILTSFGALTAVENVETLDPTIQSLDIEEFSRLLILTVMEREEFQDGDIPAVRGILAIMSCVASFKSPTEEDLLDLLRVIQLEITQDLLHSIITRLFPILYTRGGNALRLVFPPCIVCGFLSHQQKSGRFYVDMVEVKNRLAQHCLPTEPAQVFQLCSNIVYERLAEPAGTAARINKRNGIRCIARSPDGSRIISGNVDGTLEIWDGRTGERIGEPIIGHTNSVSDVKFSPDGTKLVSTSRDNTMRIWDTGTRRLVWNLESDSAAMGVAYSPDGSGIVSGHSDGTLRMWDAQKGTLIAESQGRHGDAVYPVAYSPDGRRIASGSSDNTVRIWDAESGASIGEPLKGHGRSVFVVAYSPDGSSIVSVSLDQTIRIWDAHKGTLLGTLPKARENVVVDVAHSQDARTLISASASGTIRFWNTSNGDSIGVLRQGESRWDPERQVFVSIPGWWPWFFMRTQAPVYSANPLYIPEGGWLRTLDDSLFLWVPQEHRACSCHAAAESTVTANPRDKRLMQSAWREVSRDWAPTKAMRIEELAR